MRRLSDCLYRIQTGNTGSKWGGTAIRNVIVPCQAQNVPDRGRFVMVLSDGFGKAVSAVYLSDG